MMMSRLLLIFLATTGSLAMADKPDNLLNDSDLADFENPPADAHIPYGHDPLQFGELRLPPGPGPHPVAVFIHGGCWLAEYDIVHSNALTAALARHGIASWSLENRGIGDEGGGWPGTFEDVARGADRLRAIATQYDLALDRVIAMGHSAGGQLALWLAARALLPADSPFATATPLEIRGVLALAPAADFDYLYDNGTCEQSVARLLHGSPKDYPDRYAWTDPMRFRPGEARQVILVGKYDDTWTAPARNYFGLARKRGDNIQLIEAPEAGHFELIDPRSTTWSLVLESARGLLAVPAESSSESTDTMPGHND